jgi:hypothetical protein
VSEPQPQPESPVPQPAGDTAADVAGRLGEHVGRFALLAVRRLAQMASVGAAMAEQAMARQVTAAQAMAAQPMTTPAGAAERDGGDPATTAPDAPTPDSTTARAEALVDSAGAQLGTLATLVSHQLRRAAALAREEAEDMWAEAQQIRAAQRRDDPDRDPDGRQGNIS